MPVSFAGLSFKLPAGWTDITDELPSSTPPTLARADGVGAIQFSFARAASGERPVVTLEALGTMFDAHPDFSAITAEIVSHESPQAVGGATRVNGGHLGAWYVSNGRDVTLVTYVADLDGSQAADEIADAKSIVRSIRFPRT